MSEKILNISAFEIAYCMTCPKTCDSEEMKKCMVNKILEQIEKGDKNES